jgi:hypothetical protein
MVIRALDRVFAIIDNFIEYIYQNYGIKCSVEYIRVLLKRSNLSYKRAQRKPTKANKAEQETFKKMRDLLPIIENSSDKVLYALDETRLRTESDIRRTWNKIGVYPALEINNSHEGLNLIGATEITQNFDTVIDAYCAKHSIKSDEVEIFLERLLEINEVKKVYVLLDNAKFYTSKEIQDFADAHSEDLILIK